MKNTNKNMMYTFWSGAILLCLALVAVVLVFTNAVGNTGSTKAEATPAVVDMVLLQKVTDFLFQWQADHNTRLDQDKIGAIIAILYRIAASSGKVRKAELEQVLAIAA